MSLILAEDGRVHTGDVEQRMGCTLMQTKCGALPLRPIGTGERWWLHDGWRSCPTCKPQR